MGGTLAQLLAREQRAFLGRDRSAWAEHLRRVRAFLGEGLARADRDQPGLILGAGSGLEIPWEIAPRGVVGWDADPWSRARTFLRHRRWPAWVFDDLTGTMEDLEILARRCAQETWGRQKVRPTDLARARFAGLLPSQALNPGVLQSWIAEHQPGTILSANVMGQFGAVVQDLLGAHLGAWWEEPFPPEELTEALEGWVARVLRAHLLVLAQSAAELWLVYDRGVVHGGQKLTLGPWTEPWSEQILGRGQAELEDPLGGVEVVEELEAQGRSVERRERWLWPVAPDQVHLVEAVHCVAGPGAPAQ
jgi:hypothetical protein